MQNKTRIDKWLWSVRLYKSRTMATDACKAGRIKIKQETAKASSPFNIGDTVEVRKNGFNFTYKILQALQKRVGAPLAIAAYENLTPPEELNKFNAWFVGKSAAEIREKGEGRPTKKERREIDEFKFTEEE